MSALANAIVAYVAEETRRRGRGPMHQLSISVDEIERVFDIDSGAAQTAIRKAWAELRLHVEVCRGDDCAHSVMLGELRS
jgi:hypothetical protein